jgi:iron-sulfur cluster assembly accessory protein
MGFLLRRPVSLRLSRAGTYKGAEDKLTMAELTIAKRSAPTVSLTAAAAARLHAIAAAEGRRLMLRVAVDGGGCSGFQYRFELVDAVEDGDLLVERDGAAAVVDEISLPLIKGSEIDFADELAAAEFRVRNPNAKSSCGCGVSFSI